MEEKVLRSESSSSSKPYLEKLTLGVTRILEASPGDTEVTFMEKVPAERHAILSWEQHRKEMLTGHNLWIDPTTATSKQLLARSHRSIGHCHVQVTLKVQESCNGRSNMRTTAESWIRPMSCILLSQWTTRCANRKPRSGTKAQEPGSLLWFSATGAQKHFCLQLWRQSRAIVARSH